MPIIQHIYLVGIESLRDSENDLIILQARYNINSLYPGLSTASLTRAVVNTGKDRRQILL